MSLTLDHPVLAQAEQPPRAEGFWSTLTWMDLLAVVLIVGNLSSGRSFAHLGIRPLYIGELSLVIFMLLRWRALLATWITALMRPEPLTGLIWLLTLAGVYGLFACLRGIDAGNERMPALLTFMFNIYPVFLFYGLWVGLRHRDILPRLIRALAWLHGLYGVTYMAFFHRFVDIENLQAEDVTWFGDPGGSAVVILGLLAMEPQLRKVWFPFLLNLGVLLAMQVRAEMLGLAVGVLIWSLLSGHLGRLFLVGTAGGLLLLAAAAVDLRIPSPQTRGGEISARTLLGKLIAPLDARAAKALKRDADVDAETVEWRTGWWREIRRRLDRTPEETIFGLGYGYPIWDLHPLGPLEAKVRTPHNVFMFALAYTGYVGVAFFAATQLTLAWLLWRVYRLSGQTFGLCLWATLLCKGSFENFFEAPFNAIPFYLLIGMALAPLFGAAPSPRTLSASAEGGGPLTGRASLGTDGGIP
jgi:hypothetical protein